MVSITTPTVGEDNDAWGGILNTALTTLESALTTAESDITSLESTVSGHTSSIAANASAITALDTRVGTLEADGTITPADHGIITWTQDPATAPSGFSLNAGVVYLSKVKVGAAATASTISYGITTAGVDLTSGQNFVGLYDSSGTLLVASADQTANFGALGLKTTAITSQPLTAGFYYVAFLANYATSAPSVVGGGGVSSAMNLGLTAANARALTSGTGQTALPSSITLSSGTLNIALRWAALD